MSDNATAHAARDYDAEVRRTIPFHDELLRTAVDVALSALPSPSRWLDTGCGPGKLAALAHQSAPRTEIWLADPSAAMLEIARERNPEVSQEHVFEMKSEELPAIGPFDVVTAIQCHHYGDAAARERSVSRCRDLLSPNGVLVVFENVLAETSEGHALQRERWAEWMRRQGRDDATITRQTDREGKSFFPIRVSEHMALFARLGLRAELVWRAYGQAGFLVVRS